MINYLNLSLPASLCLAGRQAAGWLASY